MGVQINKEEFFSVLVYGHRISRLLNIGGKNVRKKDVVSFKANTNLNIETSINKACGRERDKFSHTSITIDNMIDNKLVTKNIVK